jgi:drug/metabolite transporter (DMT)-like permease
MQSLPAAHGAVAIGLLPAMTALMGVLRAGERPSGLFWIVCAAGVLCVLAFAVSEGTGRPQPGAALLLGEPIRPPTALASLTLIGVAVCAQQTRASSSQA